MKKKKLFRRINRLGTLCALSGVLVLAACTEEAATESQADGAAIRFDVGLSETWESGGFAPSAVPAAMSSAKCPDTRTGHGTESSDDSGASARRSTASNITVTVIDGLPPRTKAAGPRTRGAQKVGNNADNGEISFDEAFGGTDKPGFGVFGYACDEGESNWWTYITNTQITENGGYWGAAEGQACNWPGTWRNCRMRFFAYAPYTDETNTTLEQNTDGNLTIKIPYTTPDADADEQKEFLVAATNVYDYDSWSNWGDDDVVNLNFTHTLTAVRFLLTFTEAPKDIDVNNDVTVSHIEFNDVYTTGTYSVTYDETGNMIAGEWNEGDMNTGTLTLEPISNSLSKSTDDDRKEWYWPENQNWQENAPDDFFLMIPQIPPSYAKVTVYFNNDNAFIAFDLPDDITAAWQPNTTVIYHLSVSLGTLNGKL